MKRTNVRLLLLVGFLALLTVQPTDVWAERLSSSAGTLANAQATTGVSANSVIADGSTSIYFEITVSAAGPSIALRQQITGSSTPLNLVAIGILPATATSIYRVDLPAGIYDAYTTISSGGPVTIKYQMEHEW